MLIYSDSRAGLIHPYLTSQTHKMLRSSAFISSFSVVTTWPRKIVIVNLGPLIPAASVILKRRLMNMLIQCRGTSEVRERILPTLYNVVSDVQPTCRLLLFNHPPSILLQFILDCTSLNLPNDIRIPAHNPRVSEIFQVSRDLCFGISSAHCRLLRESWHTTNKDDFYWKTLTQKTSP